jgi:protein-disulfide isomerase
MLVRTIESVGTAWAWITTRALVMAVCACSSRAGGASVHGPPPEAATIPPPSSDSASTPPERGSASPDLPNSVAAIRKQREPCDRLLARLLAEFGAESETGKLVTAQTASLRPERCTKMLERYDEVLAELRKMVKDWRPLSREQQIKLTAQDAPSLGPADAPVTMLEFADFQCPYSAKVAALLPTIRARYGKQIRVVFHQFPLSFHADAETAAIASFAAQAQGKFWEYHDLLYANQQALDRGSLEDYAKRLKLDVGAFRSALYDPRLKARLAADVTLGQQIPLQGTPTVWVNGKRVLNPTAIESLSEAIDKALGH